MANSGETSEGGGSGSASASVDLRKRQEALQEYYAVQGLIDGFDERCLKIKSWSGTSSGVALGFGLVEKSSILFCLAGFRSLIFWYLEGLWKARQRVVIERAHALEELLAKGPESYSGPQISDQFSRRLSNYTHAKQFAAVLYYRNVRLPHLFIFLASALLFLGSMLNVKLQGILGP